jgi:WD repeat-containing protein 19
MIFDDRFDVKQHNTQCYAGIARTSIKTGDTHRGVNIANELTEKGLIIELGNVCEQVK